MNKQKKHGKINLQEERGTGLAGGDAAVENLLQRLRDADQRMKELASHIPTFTPEQIHTLISSRRMSQFELRRQADRYLLAFCLCFLALVASVLWYTAPAGITLSNVVLVAVAVADVWVAVRAAYSLWLMQRSLRLRPHPYRMSRCADRLNRLSHRRRLWLRFVLRDGSLTKANRQTIQAVLHSTPLKLRQSFIDLRAPSFSIAACLLLFVALDCNKVFATTHDYENVTTTTERTGNMVCDTVNSILAHL